MCFHASQIAANSTVRLFGIFQDQSKGICYSVCVSITCLSDVVEFSWWELILFTIFFDEFIGYMLGQMKFSTSTVFVWVRVIDCFWYFFSVCVSFPACKTGLVVHKSDRRSLVLRSNGSLFEECCLWGRQQLHNSIKRYKCVSLTSASLASCNS